MLILNNPYSVNQEKLKKTCSYCVGEEYKQVDNSSTVFNQNDCMVTEYYNNFRVK